MEIFIADNYAQLSQQAADDLITFIKGKKQPVLCTASGDTPAGMYKVLIDKMNKNELDMSSCFFIGLDEWVGMNGGNEGSCRFHLDNQLFFPLQIKKDQIIFFDGKAKDSKKECEVVENFIYHQGGIDIAIVGLGMNGHIGMNEPGTSAGERSHVTALDPVTQKVGQKYFKEQKQLTEGITLGLRTLKDARHIFLLVSGAHKAAIVQQVMEDEISEKVPGSLLRDHAGLRVYLDKEAAQLLQS